LNSSIEYYEIKIRSRHNPFIELLLGAERRYVEKDMKRILLSMLILTAGCAEDVGYDRPASQAQTQMETSSSFFESAVPKPSWFESVSAPELNSLEEIYEVWQSYKWVDISKRRFEKNSREFNKACYIAVVEYDHDEEMVVTCLWLMGIGLDRNTVLQIDEYLITHYFNHRRRVDNCANCAPGDTVARVGEELSIIKFQQGLPVEATSLLERILDERREEISPWVQAELLTTLGRMYLDEDLTEERIQRFENAYFILAPETESIGGARFQRFAKIHQEVLR
jgi:hypothetical protein